MNTGIGIFSFYMATEKEKGKILFLTIILKNPQRTNSQDGFCCLSLVLVCVMLYTKILIAS